VFAVEGPREAFQHPVVPREQVGTGGAIELVAGGYPEEVECRGVFKERITGVQNRLM
jgi:hypothetical protein